MPKCRTFSILERPMSHTGKTCSCFFFFLFFSYKIIIDFSSLSYQLCWAPPARWAFFPSSKNLTPTDLARFYPHKSRGSGAARDSSISSNCLLAEHLSLYRSRPFTLSHSARELSSGHTAGFADICGYTVCAHRVYFGTPTAKPQTRGLARPNLKPKPTLLPRV